MSKVAFIFPGQGAQYVGMGQDFYEQIPVAKEVFDLASQATGLDLPALCFRDNDQLNITEYTQIAMLTTSVAMLKALEEKGIRAQVTAGLSLGEYGALVAAGVLSAEDAFKLVRKRGIYMQEAYPQGGAMSAVLGTETALIEQVCQETEGIVTIANYNCPGQIVITGEEKAVAAAGEALKEKGAKRVVPLKVSGPFHSALLTTAGEKLAQELEHVTINDPQIPYVCNVLAEYVTDSAQVADLLSRQVSASVRWQQSVEKMLAEGVDTFIEIGPGKTLSGFMRKISRDVTMMNVENVEDLEKVVEQIG